MVMGWRCVGTEGARAPRFLEANVKSLIFTIDAPRFKTFAYCATPDFYATSRLFPWCFHKLQSLLLETKC